MIEEEILDEKYIKETRAICEEKKTINLFSNILKGYYFNNLSLWKLKVLFNKVKELYDNLKLTIEKIEIEQFAKDELDIKALQEEYRTTRRKDIKQVYPKIKLKKLKEFYDDPITKLKSPCSKYNIKFDSVVSRKYVIAVMQMLFNQMDLVVAYCGIEGTGKTTGSTQDAYLCYYILKEIGVIDYDYTLRNTMYFSLKQIIQAFTRFSKMPFKIFILDEGNELNRKNWSNPLVQLFIQKLRRERKHLRIVFINLPQLGELATDLTLARINFVFQLSMKYNNKTKLVDKGDCAFFIIPRSDRIYSYVNKTELTNSHIRDTLGKILDDKKKYYKLLPMYLAVKRFRRNGVWSFRESEYDKLSKEANDQFATYSATLTRNEIYYLTKHLDMRKMKIKSGTKDYFCLTNLLNKKLKPIIKNSEEFADYKEEENDNTAET